jgi:cytochrome P450
MTYRLLGLPEASAVEFVQNFEAATSGGTGVDDLDEAAPGHGLLAHFDTVMSTIAARRATPSDDIISYLVHADIDGEPLDDTELLGFVSLILAGGLLTTTDAIGNALIQLERQPEDRARLRREPSLIPMAVEEFLRFEAPVMGLARTATRDTELNGQRIAKGDKVLMLWASANRDAAAFPEPDRCILDRPSNRHMAFGVGIHRCLGSNLGRLEFRIALEEILRRMPDHRIDLDNVVMAPVVGVTYGRVRIPMTFTPGDRER